MFSSALMQVMFYIGLALTIIGLVIYFMRPSDSEKPNSFSGANFSFNVSHPGLWVFGVGAVMLIISLLSGMDSNSSAAEINSKPYPQDQLTYEQKKPDVAKVLQDENNLLSIAKDTDKQNSYQGFSGNFTGYANGLDYNLHLTAGNNEVNGNMQEGQSSFSLYGQITGNYLFGNVHIPDLGNIPFQAYYQGSNLILQLDPDTINTLKLLGAIVAEDISLLFAEDKIIFHQN